MDEEDIDFIGSKSSEFVEQNMESLNLFGVPLDSMDDVQTQKERIAKKRFLADIIDILAEEDNASELSG